MSDKEKKGQEFLDNFEKNHTCIIKNCIGLYLFEKGIRFDLNQKLIRLDEFYDVYRHNSHRSYVAIPINLED
jgi:hypothetical protein